MPDRITVRLKSDTTAITVRLKPDRHKGSRTSVSS